MTYIKISAVIALLISCGWVYHDPSFEPALAVVVSFSTLLSAFIIEKRKIKRAQQQQQAVSGNSLGIQAGGNVNIGNSRSDDHAK